MKRLKRPYLEVIRGTVPYYFLMVFFLFALAIFPVLANWLPAQISGR